MASGVITLVSGGSIGGYGVTTQRIISCECHGSFAILTVVDKRSGVLVQRII